MRLENVRSFASAVDRELGPAQINSLVLNAGLLQLFGTKGQS
jgi:hypothetical protein